nr:hypothetical protein [Rubrobacter marinus]
MAVVSVRNHEDYLRSEASPSFSWDLRGNGFLTPKNFSSRLPVEASMLRNGQRQEMVGVHAGRNSAPMVKLVPVLYGAVSRLVEKPVRHHSSMLVALEDPAVAAVTDRSFPYPTGGVVAAIFGRVVSQIIDLRPTRPVAVGKERGTPSDPLVSGAGLRGRLGLLAATAATKAVRDLGKAFVPVGAMFFGRAGYSVHRQPPRAVGRAGDVGRIARHSCCLDYTGAVA